MLHAGCSLDFLIVADFLILASPNRADLANLVNEAALLAGRANKLVVGNSEFSQAVERSIAVRPCQAPK